MGNEKDTSKFKEVVFEHRPPKNIGKEPAIHIHTVDISREGEKVEPNPELPSNAMIDWDHIFLVCTFGEDGEAYSTWYRSECPRPMVHVVVTGRYVMGSGPAPKDSEMIAIPKEVTEFDEQLKFAKKHDGTLALGYYVEEGIMRRISQEFYEHPIYRRMAEERGITMEELYELFAEKSLD